MNQPEQKKTMGLLMGPHIDSSNDCKDTCDTASPSEQQEETSAFIDATESTIKLIVDNSSQSSDFSEDDSSCVHDINTPSMSSHDGHDESVGTSLPVKKKRIRFRNRRRIYAPRVLKKDIRRQYATMMVNVFNSFDEKVFASFLGTFAVPSMQVQKLVVPELPSSDIFKEAFRNQIISGAVSGMQWSMVHFLVLKSLCPDNVMRILSTKLLTRSDTAKTLLTITVQLDFTRIHNVHPLLFTEDMFEAFANEQQTTETNSSMLSALPDAFALHNIAHRTDPFSYFQHKVGLSIPLLAEPQSVSFVGTINVLIDEAKRVERVDIVDAGIA